MPTVNTLMQGKVCMVTGATSGIGKATALGLAQIGATVVMVSRDRARGEAAQSEIKTKSGNNAVDLLIADLSSQQSIRQLAENFKRNYTQLHVLINNAGVFMLTRRETVDGLEMTFAVDYLAPLARRLQGTGVTANCLHPGFVATNFAQRDLWPIARTAAKLVLFFGISPEEGAKTSIYLASSPDVEGVTGKYFVKSIPKRSTPISYDESLQQQLWEESAKLVNLP